MAHPDKPPCPYCGDGCLSVGDGRVIYACGAIDDSGKWNRSPDCLRNEEKKKYLERADE